MSEPSIPAFLVTLEDRFNAAMISNDVERIAACISDDWVLVTPEVGPVSRAGMLAAISSGTLSHDTMTKEIHRAVVYGDTAVVTGRGQNTGLFRGAPIAADEWITDVYRRIDGDWRCVLTHLSPATGDHQAGASGSGSSRNNDGVAPTPLANEMAHTVSPTIATSSPK